MCVWSHSLTLQPPPPSPRLQPCTAARAAASTRLNGAKRRSGGILLLQGHEPLHVHLYRSCVKHIHLPPRYSAQSFNRWLMVNKSSASLWVALKQRRKLRTAALSLGNRGSAFTKCSRCTSATAGHSSSSSSPPPPLPLFPGIFQTVRRLLIGRLPAEAWGVRGRVAAANHLLPPSPCPLVSLFLKSSMTFQPPSVFLPHPA